MMIKSPLAFKLFAASAAIMTAFTFASVASAVSMDDFGTATLRQGSAGDQVINVQGTLNWPACGGYTVTMDGRYGVQTRSIVASFQASRGLVADGVVGPSTKSALAACLNEQIALVVANH